MTNATKIFVGGVRGGPKIILRAEGATVLAVAMLAYAHGSASWWLFVALFLVPDLSMLGYFVGRGTGAAFYNMAHSYIAPALTLALGTALGANIVPIVLVWVGHIGFDRLMGYGLKYRTAFGDTHLGQVGRARV